MGHVKVWRETNLPPGYIISKFLPLTTGSYLGILILSEQVIIEINLEEI
jgi:hypothetical protein